MTGQRNAGWEAPSDAGSVNPAAEAATPEEEAEEGQRHCLCIDIPPGDHSCLTFECADCDLCDPSGCELRKVVVFPLSAPLCWFTFGIYSTWYSRTLCGKSLSLVIIIIVMTSQQCRVDLDDDQANPLPPGILFPLFALLVGFCLAVDVVWLAILFVGLLLGTFFVCPIIICLGLD